MIQSTKPNYTRWLQPASIEEENVPEGEDHENPNYAPPEAGELESGRRWYVENYHRDPPANWTRAPVAWQGTGGAVGSAKTRLFVQTGADPPVRQSPSSPCLPPYRF